MKKQNKKADLNIHIYFFSDMLFSLRCGGVVAAAVVVFLSCIVVHMGLQQRNFQSDPVIYYDKPLMVGSF